MSDRLKELLRQRELLQEQMAWLDGEIAAARGAQAPQKPSPLPPPVPSEKPPAISVPVAKSPAYVDAAAAERAAEEILAQYQHERESLQSTVKRGCFIYFFIAFALLGVGVLALYIFRTK